MDNNEVADHAKTLAAGQELSDEDLSGVAGGTVAPDASQEQLRLQMLMEKKHQQESTLSNVLKTFDSSQRDLIANLK